MGTSDIVMQWSRRESGEREVGLNPISRIDAKNSTTSAADRDWPPAKKNSFPFVRFFGLFPFLSLPSVEHLAKIRLPTKNLLCGLYRVPQTLGKASIS